ncbi:MAG: recombinase family protein [Anaerolineae bacterium]|nr:recombinase family protein [Anaerolineae bacterium]
MKIQDNTQNQLPLAEAKRAVVYARVSKYDRKLDSRNLHSQLEMGCNYAQDKGYSVIEQLAEDDRGASGVEINLPQLNRVRELAERKAFDILIVREIDRLSRNLAKQLIVEEELKRAGVKIEYVLADYENTPEGRLSKHIRATIAEYEREKIMERMSRGRENKVKAGNVIVGDMVPYGYKVVGDGKLEIFEPEARIIRLIFDWYTFDGLSLRGVKKELDKMEVPVPSKAPAHKLNRKLSGKWATTTIHGMLKSKTYIGTWHYGKQSKKNIIPVDVPAIVSKEVWQVAQTRLQENKKLAKRNRRRSYLLSNHSTCGLCGFSITGITKKSGKHQYGYYACNVRHSTDKYLIDCDMPYVRADQVDPLVWNWLKGLMEDEEKLRRGLTAYQNEKNGRNKPITDRIEVLDDLLAKYGGQLEKLLDLYLSGEIPKQMLSDRKSRLEKTVSSLETERSSLVDHLQAILTDEDIDTITEFAHAIRNDFREFDESDDFEGKRRLLELLDVKVTFTIEDNQKIVYVQCVLDSKRLSVASQRSSTRYREKTTTGRVGHGR